MSLGVRTIFTLPSDSAFMVIFEGTESIIPGTLHGFSMYALYQYLRSDPPIHADFTPGFKVYPQRSMNGQCERVADTYIGIPKPYESLAYALPNSFDIGVKGFQDIPMDIQHACAALYQLIYIAHVSDALELNWFDLDAVLELLEVDGLYSMDGAKEIIFDAFDSCANTHLRVRLSDWDNPEDILSFLDHLYTSIHTDVAGLPQETYERY